MMGKLVLILASLLARMISAFQIPALHYRQCFLQRSFTALHLSSSTTTSSSSSTQRSRASMDADGTCIVGGGLAGLATAAALRNIGGVQSVQVLEKCSDDDFSSTLKGAAVQLGPNGLRALLAIGGENLLNSIISEGTCLEGNAIIMPAGQGSSTTDGRTKTTEEQKDANIMLMSDQTEEETGLPQVLIRWGILRAMLSGLLPDDSITTMFGEDIIGYSSREQDGRTYVNPVSSSTTGGGEAEDTMIPLLVAADGIYSTFQSLVHSGESVLPAGNNNADEVMTRKLNIKDGGRINIKGVAPDSLGDEYKPGYTYSFFSADGSVACFAGPAGDGYTYWAISVADQVSADGGEAKRFLANVPQSDGDTVKNELLTKLRNLHSPECRFAIDMIEKTDPTVLFVARSEEREHVGPSLVSKDGLVVLVGDAAHAMSPAYGQAANFAFEDAATLATCIRDGDDLKSSLHQYSDMRVSRCTEMQRRSVERTAKATRGEKTEDISKWIFQWSL